MFIETFGEALEKPACETIRLHAFMFPPSTVKLYSMIKTFSYSHLRAKLATVLDQACETLVPIIVERRGKPAIALIDANESILHDGFYPLTEKSCQCEAAD